MREINFYSSLIRLKVLASDELLNKNLSDIWIPNCCTMPWRWFKNLISQLLSALTGIVAMQAEKVTQEVRNCLPSRDCDEQTALVFDCLLWANKNAIKRETTKRFFAMVIKANKSWNCNIKRAEVALTSQRLKRENCEIQKVSNLNLGLNFSVDEHKGADKGESAKTNKS